MSINESTLELGVKALCTFVAMFLVAGSLAGRSLLLETDTDFRHWLVDSVALVERWPQEPR